MPDITLDLGGESWDGGVASMDVFLTFDASHSNTERVVLFQIDVSLSDGALTDSGSDYSAFSFAPSPSVAQWDEMSAFGPASSSVVGYHLEPELFASSALVAGAYVIGTLQVDLAGLAPGTVTVAIDGADTDAGFDDPVGGVGAYGMVGDQIEYSTSARTLAIHLPVPAALWLSLPLLAVLAGSKLRRRRLFG